MTAEKLMNVVLLDPSLFTAPYDACLSEGLVSSGARAIWVVRPLREGEADALHATKTLPFFYAGIDGNKRLPAKLRLLLKGIDHILGLAKTFLWVLRHRPSVVHMQWVMLPLLDAVFCLLIRMVCPLVVTVHDSTPYNGDRFSVLRSLGFDFILRRADAVIVHTQSARVNLLKRGLVDKKIAVIPHGPLPLAVPMSDEPPADRDPRVTVTLFGQIKPYKGLALLIEAAASLTAQDKANLRIIVAGKPFMDMEPSLERIRELGLGAMFDLRLVRLSDEEMTALFSETDAFVFPYSQIDASGVYYLVKGLKRWLIASRVGVFAEDMRDGETGRLVPTGDVAALTAALSEAVRRRAAPTQIANDQNWSEIGNTTRELYESIVEQRGKS